MTDPAGPRRPSVTQLVVVIAILALLVGGLGGALLTRDSDHASGKREVFLEPRDEVGPRPFSRSVTARPPASLPTSTSTARVAPAANQVVSVAGSAAGLYGGTLNATSCDRDKLATFLEQHPDKGAAWAAVQGIRASEIRDYIATLTPAILLHDTRVTNHGFAHGHATPRQSVLQSGTAVLVDHFGIPRARCSCGNPLTSPTPLSDPTPVGAPWPGYDQAAVVVVVMRVQVDVFVLVDVRTGSDFERPAGTDGGSDTVDGSPVEPGLEPEVGVDGDAGPGTDVVDGPAPVTTPTGSYTVQFSGEQLSPPCSPWGAGTGAMTVTVTDSTVAVTLSRDGGGSTDYAGTYDPATGAFSAPDVQYGVTPLTGTFQKVDGVFAVADGRSNGHNAGGGPCIGAFTAIQTVG
jgi:hypothetical protein